jgi:hypothetical protein
MGGFGANRSPEPSQEVLRFTTFLSGFNFR